MDDNQLIEMAAFENFSNYAGELQSEQSLGDDASANYIGEKDPWIDFGGIAKTFADPIAKGRIYTMNFKNTHATQFATILLTPGLLGIYDTVPGVIKSGTFLPRNASDGFDLSDPNKLCIGSGGPGSIELFKAFLQQQPLSVIGMKISASSPDQIEQNFELQRQTPFKTLETRPIFVAAHTDETANKDKVATVAEQFQLDNETQLSYLLLPNTSVVLTLFCGASLSIAKALKEKSTRAGRNIKMMGGSGNVSAARASKI